MNKLLYILISIIIILILAIGGGMYFIYSSTKTVTTKTELVQEEDKGISFKYDFKDLIININNQKGENKLLKISFTVKSMNEKTIEIMDKYNADITDSLINILSGMNSEILLTSQGKILLKDNMILEFNKIIELNEPDIKTFVKEILFTSLVIK